MFDIGCYACFALRALKCCIFNAVGKAIQIFFRFFGGEVAKYSRYGIGICESQTEPGCAQAGS